MEYSQRDMMRRLPKATHVDRADFLISMATGKSVVHVGFVDTGYEVEQRQAGTWLHERLAKVTKTLVGVDVNSVGVEGAKAANYEAHCIDLSDPGADLSSLSGHYDTIIAGEVIEHVENIGAFVRGIARIANNDTKIVFTTPNSSAMVQALLAVGRREICHPDHVVAFTAATLTGMLERCGLSVDSIATYSSKVRLDTSSGNGKTLALAGRVALFFERMTAQFISPYVASGLIVVAVVTV